MSVSKVGHVNCLFEHNAPVEYKNKGPSEIRFALH